MTALHRVPMLRITQCPDSMRWYRDLVGQLVPHTGWGNASGYRSHEPSGFVNFVSHRDAKTTQAFVTLDQLDRWPYVHVKHLSKPPVIVEDRQSTERIIQHYIAEDMAKRGWPKPSKPHSCAASCNAMGICQALEDCQDKPRIDDQLAKPVPTTSQATPVGQSRAHSMAETLASIAVGFVVSMALQALVLPAMGHHITLAENFWITCIFTVASVLRGYGMRRFFNHLHTRGAKP